MKTGAMLLEGNFTASIKTTYALSFDSIVSLWIYPEDTPPAIWKYVCRKLFAPALSVNRNNFNMHIQECDWINYATVTQEYYVAVKKDWGKVICNLIWIQNILLNVKEHL